MYIVRIDRKKPKPDQISKLIFKITLQMEYRTTPWAC